MRPMLWIFIFMVAYVLGFVVIHAQTVPVRNPGGVVFLCPDHATDTDHEVDIVRESDGVVIQTILGGDPPLNAQNEVIVALNVQPVPFGQYRFRVRAVAGTLKSENSVPSDIWERAPGRPTNVQAR